MSFLVVDFVAKLLRRDETAAIALQINILKRFGGWSDQRRGMCPRTLDQNASGLSFG